MLRRLRGKVLIVIAVSVFLLASGVGVAMARGSTPGPHHPDGAVLERAAEILGIDAETLANAIKQAGQEVQRERLDERVASRLAHIVEAGGLTQSEADNILAWWQGRPLTATPRILAFAFRPRLGPGLVLSPVVERDALTQEKADAIRAWWGSQPESFDPALVLPHQQKQLRHRLQRFYKQYRHGRHRQS